MLWLGAWSYPAATSAGPLTPAHQAGRTSHDGARTAFLRESQTEGTQAGYCSCAADHGGAMLGYHAFAQIATQPPIERERLAAEPEGEIISIVPYAEKKCTGEL